MNEDQVPTGWTVWSSEPGGRTVLAFRPEVFDGEAFPPECMPTIYVSRYRDPRDRATTRADRPWQIELRLEPAVLVVDRRVRTHDDAIETALALADAFVCGEVDYREAYLDPRERYLAALDRIVAAASSERDA